MMTREQMQILRRARVECLILGMALARPDDRKYILDNCLPGDFQSDIVIDVLQGIREQNAGAVKAALGKWGIDVTDTVSATLIGLAKEFGEIERAKGVLQQALLADDSDLKSVLSKALGELCNHED